MIFLCLRGVCIFLFLDGKFCIYQLGLISLSVTILFKSIYIFQVICYLLKYIYIEIYIFEGKLQRESGWYKVIFSIFWFTPQITSMARTGQPKPEYRSVTPDFHVSTGTQVLWLSSTAFWGTIVRSIQDSNLHSIGMLTFQAAT